MKDTKIYKALLGLIGITAVGSCGNGGGMMCMYGCPTSDFKVSGKVLDPDKNPIEGIQITAPESYGMDTLKTAKDGSFTAEGAQFSSSQVVLKFEDVDGELNGGEFKAQSDTIQLKQTKKGDDAWYSGEYSASDVKITLKK